MRSQRASDNLPMLIFYVSILTLSAATAVVLGLYSWRSRPAPGAIAFTWLLFALALWSLGALFELISSTLIAKMFWSRVEYIGIVIVPAAWLMLGIRYAGMGKWITRPFLALLIIEPLLTLGMVYTNGIHRLFWSGIELVETPTFLSMYVSYGPFFIFHASYSYILLLAGTLLMGRTFLLAPKIYHKQSIILLASIFVPWAGNLVYLLRLGPFGLIDMTPVAFTLISPALAWGIFRLRLLDLIPLAYDQLVEGMSDGILVLDSRDQIIYINPAAELIFGKSSANLKGCHSSTLPIPLPLVGSPTPGTSSSRERTLINISIERPKGPEYYQIQVAPLARSGVRSGGRIIILNNVTHHKAAAQALRRRAEEMAALGATLLDIAATHDLQDLMQAIVARAVRLLDASAGLIMKTDLDRRELVCLVTYNCTTYQENQVIRFGEGAAGTVAQTGQPLLISDYPSWTEKRIDFEQDEKISSLLSVPLIWRQEVLGVVNVVHHQIGRQFEYDDLDLLVMFANQAALAFENSRLFEAEQRRAREAETLRQAAALVAATLNPEEAIQLILEQLARVVPYDSASVQMLRDGYLEIVGGRGWPEPELVIGARFPVPGNNPNTRVVQERRYLICGQELDDYPSFHRKSTGNRISSWLGVPLLVHDSVIGMLAVDSRQPGAFVEQDARLALAFAGQVAIAMENARLYAETRQRAEELSSLFQAAQDLSGTLDTAVVLEQLARHLTAAIGATSGRIFEMSTETGKYKVLAEYWSTDALPEEKVPRLGSTLTLEPGKSDRSGPLSSEPVSYHAADPDLSEVERRQLSEMGVKSILILPIVARGRTLGAAVLGESRRFREFTPDEKRIGKAMAQHGAGVIDNAQLYHAVHKRAGEMDALRATLADLSSELELPRLLRAIIERAVSMLGATGGDLGIYEEASQLMKIVVSFNLDKNYTGTTMALGEGAMGYVALNRTPLIIHNYQEWEGRSPQYSSTSMFAVLAAPLLIAGKLVGSLGIADINPERHFTPEDQHLLTLFAQQAAIAIQNARLYQEATQAAERRATLHQVSQEIVTARLDSRAIYAAVHRAAARIMPSEAFALTLLDEADYTVTAVYLVDKNGEIAPFSFPANQGLSGYVIASGKSIIIKNVPQDSPVELVHFSENRDVHSILAVPVRLGGAIKGMLSCQSYSPNAYNEEDRSLLETLAAYAAIALENARLFQEVQHLAVTDPLTGVKNRRHLYDLGNREFNRALRFHRPLAAIMLDVDNFKDLNDRYGHNTGDRALITISERLKHSIREIDILARYGGDEFVIILPETDAAAAQLVAERLTTNIIQNPLKTEFGDIFLSVSLGYAVASAETATLEILLGLADRAMYKAKEESRKRAGRVLVESGS